MWILINFKELLDKFETRSVLKLVLTYFCFLTLSYHNRHPKKDRHLIDASLLCILTHNGLKVTE